MAEGELHKTIKDKAVDYLMAKGYRVAKAEVSDHYYGIIDAWGIHPRLLYTMGIEVKISRSDWKAAKAKDRRADMVMSNPEMKGWTGTNEIYYVCPAGLIQPYEIAPATGLLWYNANGRFVNKKKPYFLKLSLENKIQTLLTIYQPFYKYF